MGTIHPPTPVLIVLAAFSRHAVALDWAQDCAAQTWGPIALASERFDFRETDYYRPSMGADLKKVFWAFERLGDPATLPAMKHLTGRWEQEYVGQSPHDESRPLNLDPGYITEAKLVLASTKDHAHRIYMADGIYAEVTLHFEHRQWRALDWTFPDYRREDYQAFFTECRDYLRRRRRGR
ncbi:MAG: DUF4416 family protein [Pirellulales bacterium]